MATRLDRSLDAAAQIERLSYGCEQVLLSVRNGEALQPEDEKAFNKAYEVVQKGRIAPPQTDIVKVWYGRLKSLTHQILKTYNVKAGSKKLDGFVKIVETFDKLEKTAGAIFQNLKSRIVLATDQKELKKIVHFLESGSQLSTLSGILKSRWNSLQSDVLAINREYAKASERTDQALAIEAKLKATQKRAEEILKDLKQGNKTSPQIEKELKPILHCIQTYGHLSYTEGFLKEQWTALHSMADQIQHKLLSAQKTALVYPRDFGMDAEEESGCPYQALPDERNV